MRSDAKKQEQNLARKSSLKTILAKSVESRDPKVIILAISQLDKAAKKHLIHKNKANRKKSSLMKLLNVKPMVAEPAKTKAKTKKKVSKKK